MVVFRQLYPIETTRSQNIHNRSMIERGDFGVTGTSI